MNWLDLLDLGSWPGIILCMRPVNERRRYSVMPSLIDWAHTQNNACMTKPKYATLAWLSLWFIIYTDVSFE